MEWSFEAFQLNNNNNNKNMIVEAQWICRAEMIMVIKLKNDADDCHFALFTRSEVTFLKTTPFVVVASARSKFMVRVHIQVQFASFFCQNSVNGVLKLTLSLSRTANIHIYTGFASKIDLNYWHGIERDFFPLDWWRCAITAQNGTDTR